MPSFTDTLELIISANAQGAVSELNSFAGQVDSKLSSLSGKLSTFGTNALKLGGAGLAAGGFLTALGSKEQEAGQQLEAAIASVGQSYEDYRGQIDQTIEKQASFGHTEVETKNALQTLTTAYGDTGKALNEMGLVADLAAAKHESLTEAATQVAKAHGGAARIFKEFGVQVQANADGTKNYDGALDVLAGKLNGQAAAASDSFMGHLRALGAEVENTVANFGEKFGPAILGVSAGLTALGGIVDGVAAVMSKLGAGNAAKGLQDTQAATEGLGAAAAGTAVETDALAASSDTAAVSIGAQGVAMDEAAVSAEAMGTAEEAAGTSSIFASTGIAGLAVGLGTLAVGFGAVAVVAYAVQGPMEHLSQSFLGTNDAAFEAAKAFKGFGDELVTLKTNLDNFGSSSQSITTDFQQFAESAVASSKGGQQFTDALNAANLTTGEFSRLVAGGASGFNAFTASLLASHQATTDQVTVLAETAAAMQNTAKGALDAAVANGHLTGTQRDIAESVNKASDGTVNYAGALDSLKGLLGPVAGQTQAVADATKAYDAAVKGLNDTLHAELDPLFGIVDAQQKNAKALGDANAATLLQTAAQNEYNAAVAKYGPASQEAASAALKLSAANSDLSDKQTTAAKSAFDMNVAENVLEGAIKSGAVSVDQARGILQGYVAQGHLTQAAADGMSERFGFLAAAVDNVAGKSVNITATANIQPALDRLNALNNFVAATARGLEVTVGGGAGASFRASGGPVTAGEGYVVGEEGPEFFMPKSSGTIIPHAELKTVPSASLGGGGSTTYSPTYQVTISGTNLNEDQIVAAIKRWEQRNGAAWRAN